MGQKVNPISNRLGIIRGWDSNWYGGKNYGDSLLEDSKIRKYLNARLAKASVSRIVIERTLKLVTITVCTARPGIIIGKATEYYTSHAYKPTQDIAKSSETGPATVIIKGIGTGMISTAIPVITIVVGIILAYFNTS